jgi:hypothetical protein
LKDQVCLFSVWNRVPRDLKITANSSPGLPIIVKEWLKEHHVYVWTIAITGDAPDLVDQTTYSKALL